MFNEYEALIEYVEFIESAAVAELAEFGTFEPTESFTWEGMVESQNAAEFAASSDYARDELI